MPTYDYECKSCGKVFEVFQQMSDEPLKKCPECGSEIKRLVGGGLGVIFKGSGFYVTDNKKSNSAAPGAKSEKKEPSKKSEKTEKKETKAVKAS